MKKLLKLFILGIFFIVSGCISCSKTDEHKLDTAEKLLFESVSDSDSAKEEKALLLFNEIIVEDPNNYRALNQRSTILANRGNYVAALGDIKKVIELRPDVSIYKLTECLFREKIERSIPKDCYQEIIDKFGVKPNETLSTTKHSDYISAGLLLGREDIRQQALEALEREKSNYNESLYSAQKEFIKNFDRETYLNEGFLSGDKLN